VSDEPGPETVAARTELADLISDAAGGLSDRDQAVLELAYRHGLDGPELAEALGVSQSNANTMVGRLRDTIERSLGALLVARRVLNNPAGCSQLAAILDGWDGHFNVLMRKRIARHIESCPTCDDERRRLVSPTALLGATPVFIAAPEWLRDRTLGEVQLMPMEGESANTGSPDTDDAGGRRRTRGWMLAVALLIGALGAVLGLTYALMQQEYVGITPTDATNTEPVPEPPSKPALTHTTAAVQTTPSVLPPAQTPEAPTPEVVTTTPVYEPPVDRTPVDEPTRATEPTPEVIPSERPSSPPSPVPNGSTPRLTPTSRARPTGIAGIPRSPAPQTPNRRVVINKPPPGSRAPAPSR
jgi:hypothetical protein